MKLGGESIGNNLSEYRNIGRGRRLYLEERRAERKKAEQGEKIKEKLKDFSPTQLSDVNYGQKLYQDAVYAGTSTPDEAAAAWQQSDTIPGTVLHKDTPQHEKLGSWLLGNDIWKNGNPYGFTDAQISSGQYGAKISSELSKAKAANAPKETIEYLQNMLDSWAHMHSEYPAVQASKKRAQEIDYANAVLRRTSRPEQYTVENLGTYMERAAALAELPEWTEEQRGEAKEIMKLDTKFKSYLVSGGDSQGGVKWMDISNKLNYKVHPWANGLVLGFSDGLGVTSLIKTVGSAVPELQGQTQMMEDAAQYSRENAPLAYGAGNLAGNAALWYDTSKLMGAIPWAESVSGTTKSVLSGAGVSAGAEAVHGLGDLAAGDVSPGDYLGNILSAGAAGGAGAALGGKITELGTDYLKRAGLANNKLAVSAIAGLSGAGYSAGYSGVKESVNILDPNGRELDGWRIFTDAVTAFAFGSLKSLAGQTIAEGKVTSAEKQAGESKYFADAKSLENLKDIRREYAKMFANVYNGWGATEGEIAAVQEINAEYDMLRDLFLSQGISAAESAYGAAAAGDPGAQQAFADAVAVINSAAPGSDSSNILVSVANSMTPQPATPHPTPNDTTRDIISRANSAGQSVENYIKDNWNVYNGPTGLTESAQQALAQQYIQTAVNPWEEYAILSYKSSTSYKINYKLRKRVDLPPDEQQVVDGLDSILPKLPKYVGTVYRNIGFDDYGGEEEYNDFLKDYSVGEPVSFSAYTSCGKKPDSYVVIGEWVVHMIIEGYSGRDVDGFGNNFEDEVIFERNSEFLVLDMWRNAEGEIVIKLREIR